METIKTKHFIIQEVKKGDIVINSVKYDWKLQLEPHTHHWSVMNNYITNNTPEELDEFLTISYYTSMMTITDVDFASKILEIFEEKMRDATPELVTDEEDAENLRVVKEDHDAKESD